MRSVRLVICPGFKTKGGGAPFLFFYVWGGGMLPWVYLIVTFVLNVFIIIWSIEVGIAFFRGIPPELPSGRKMRRAVAAEIKKHYADKKSVLDIGSGFGGMALKIARTFPDMCVAGVERMPFAYFCSRVFIFFHFRFNLTIRRQKFSTFIQDKNFDIGVSYSGPGLMKEVEAVLAAGKFKVVLSVDFPLPNTVPVRTIPLHRDRLGQHVLYVYENG